MPAHRPPPWRDALALAFVTFGMCWLLRQHTFYGPDGRAILKMAMSGMQAHPLHYFYVPLLRALHAVLPGSAGSWYDAGLLLSQLGLAGAALAWHRAAAHLAVSRVQAAAIVLLGVTTPAVLFFASVVELHAPFLAFAGLATYAAATCGRRLRTGGAVALGASTGLAVGGHATAHLLLLWLVPLAWVASQIDRAGDEVGRARLARWAGWGILVGVVHAGVTLALVPALRASGIDPHPTSAATYLFEQRQASLRLAALPAQVWRDWLVPFAPLSFVVCARSHKAPRVAAVLAAGVVPSLVATFLLTTPNTESGAYLLPLVFPAAWLAVCTLPPAVWLATALGGLGLGWRWIAGHEDTAFGRAFAAEARAEARVRPLALLCGQHREFDACLIFAPELEWRPLIDEAGLPPETVPRLVDGLRAWVTLRQEQGEDVLLTEGAKQYLLAPVGDERRTGPLLWRAIEQAFRLEPVTHAALRGWRLRTD
ncbi:MAG: hypothetical protein R3F56_17110 [Planctomycetota bacterium]